MTQKVNRLTRVSYAEAKAAVIAGYKVKHEIWNITDYVRRPIGSSCDGTKDFEVLDEEGTKYFWSSLSDLDEDSWMILDGDGQESSKTTDSGFVELDGRSGKLFIRKSTINGLAVDGDTGNVVLLLSFLPGGGETLNETFKSARDKIT